MAGTPKLEDFDKILIVEGYSDLLFYAEMLEVVERHGEVFIKQFNGRDDLEAKLETFFTPELLAAKRAIAVVVDANGNAEQTSSRLQHLLARLTGMNVAVGGWSGGERRIGLFVTPDGASSGEIERFVWRPWSTDSANQST